MKKILFRLAQLFRVDLTVEKIVKVETIKEKQVALGGVVEGDVTVTGDLIVKGRLEVVGGVSCLGLSPEKKR
jgi:cytoskeletal protein CcmA (bactofilin family)